LIDALLLDPYPFEVWVAYRTDGIKGTGTLNDPFDGSPKLDTARSVALLSNSGQEATATMSSAHGYGNGDVVNISGVTGAGADRWNGTFIIYDATTDPVKFKYYMTGVPAAASGGTITAANAGYAIHANGVKNLLTQNNVAECAPANPLRNQHTDQQLARDGVNWHFMSGALISGTASPTFLVNAAMTFKVTGAGYFAPDGSATHVLEVTNSSADIYFQGWKIQGTQSAIKMTFGANVVIEADWINGDENSAIDIAGGTLSVRARKITSDGLYGIKMSGGALDVDAFQIKSTAGQGIYFSAGTARIRAFAERAESPCANNNMNARAALVYS
jgi:hypothetical protein